MKLRRVFIIIAIIICAIGSVYGINHTLSQSNEINEYSKAQNIKPYSNEQEVTLKVTPKPILDIVLAKSKTDTDLTNFKEDLLEALEREGVNQNLVSIVNISAIETAQLSYDVSSSDASTIYNTWDQYPNPNNYLLYGAYICNLYGRTGVQQFKNDGTNAFSQMFIKADTYEASDLEFDFGIKLHGCGYGSGAIVHYNKDTNSAYLVLCSNSSSTIQIRYLSNFSSYVSLGSQPEGFGTLLTQASFSGWTTSTNAGQDVTSGYTKVSIKMEGNNMKVFINGTQYISYNIPSQYYIEKGGLGLFAGCCASFSEVSSTVKVEKVKTLSEVLREPNWADEALRVVVAVEDIVDKDLETDSTAAELATRLINDNIYIVPWGNSTNRVQFEDLIRNNNGNGTFVNNTQYDNSLQQTAQYIKSLINALPKDDNYILLNEPLGLSFDPPGVENGTADEEWPYGKWKVEHDYTYFENNLGQFADSGKYLDDFVNVFNKTGKFVITYRDLPINPTEIYVHRRPIAQINMTISGNNVTLTSDSYDLDMYSSANHGISEEEWQWKASDESTWHDGKLEGAVDMSKNYIIQLRVKDNQNTWSETVSKYITNSSEALPVAMFNVETSPVTPYVNPVVINDLSYDPSGKALTNYLWEVVKEGAGNVYTGSTPITNFSTLGTGTYTIYLTVTNSAGKKSERVAKTIEVIEDTIAPEFVATPLSGGWTKDNITVNLTFTDQGGSGYKGYQYAITNSQAVPGSYSSLITNATDNITVSATGENYIHVIAKDNAGNVSTDRVLGPYKIDKVDPNGTATVTQPTASKRAATITINATDAHSGVAKITKPDSTEVTTSTATYDVTTPGTYTFVVEDKVGNKKNIIVDVTINSDGVIIKYIDQVTGEEVATRESVTGNVGDPYTSSAKTVTGYELVKTPTNASGTLAIDDIEVVYEYRKLSDVTVEYIDENYNTKIIPDIVTTYKEEDPYDTEEKSFTGYQLTGKTSNTSGTVERDNITVTYKYKKISEGVDVHYVDQVTGDELLDPAIHYNGLEKDHYDTSALNFTGFELVGDSGNTAGEMTVAKTIVTYYYRKNSTVTANYIDANTNELMSQVETTYKEGDHYDIEEKTFTGYQLVETTDNTSGTVVRDDIIVQYLYKKISAGVEIKYINQVTGEDLVESIKKTGLERDPYTSTALDIDGYTLVKTPTNANGEMTVDKIYVVYEYRKLSDVTVEYIDECLNEKIIADVVTTYKEGDSYETEQKDLSGYECVGATLNTTGIVGDSDIKVTYRYRKLSNLITEHIDANTNAPIVENVVRAYKEGSTWEAFAQDLEGYVLVEEPTEKTGVMQRTDVVKKFYYKKISGGLVVKYVDKQRGDLLAQEIYEGNENDVITLDVKTMPGYELVERPEEDTVRLTVTAQEKKFYYKKQVELTVRGIDQETGDELYTYNINGLEGELYTTEARQLEEYKLVKIADNWYGNYDRNGRDIEYQFRKVANGVTIYYIDMDTEEELYNYRITGLSGYEYQTKRRLFEDYELVRVEGKEKGILLSNEIVVRYFYQRNKGKIEIIYQDTKGEEIYRELIEGEPGTEYVIAPKDIPNYRVKEAPENLRGTFIQGTTTMIFVMEKIPAQIKVRYVDALTGNKILANDMIDGYVGDDFVLEPKEIEGYEFDSYEGVVAGKFTADRQTVTFYYNLSDVKGEERPEDPTEPDKPNPPTPPEEPVIPQEPVAPVEPQEPVATGDMNVISLLSIFVLSAYILVNKFKKCI